MLQIKGKMPVPGTIDHMEARYEQNKDGTWWIGLEKKKTKNIRYIKKDLPTRQLCEVLSGILMLGDTAWYIRKHKPLTRPAIIKYLREVITI
jgi:hypothetical protein